VLVTTLFELFGKQVPGDAAEIATGFIALGRGMALMSGDGEARRSGQMIVTFLKALIASAAPAAGSPPPATKASTKAKSK